MMSQFTITIKELVDYGFDFQMTNYPIFDESYREFLNKKILNHYKFREIGFETPAMFRDRLNTKLDEIMPLYNQYYNTLSLEYQPFYTHDFHEIIQREGESKSSANNTTTAKGDVKSVYSDTPGGLLSMPDIEGEVYATNASIENNRATSEGDSNTDGSYNSTDDKHSFGNTSGKSMSELITEYRKSFINVDMMIIRELSELFMGLWW